MGLLTPEAHAGAYEWAAVLLAHFALGGYATACLAFVFHWMFPAPYRPHGQFALGTLLAALATLYGAGGRTRNSCGSLLFGPSAPLIGHGVCNAWESGAPFKPPIR